MNKIIIIQSENSAAWDNYVKNHANAHYCHLYNWNNVIQEVYHHKPLYLAAVSRQNEAPDKTGTVCGIFPLFQFKTFTGKPKFVSIPFFDQAGILAENNDIESLLFAKAVKLLGNSTIQSLEIRQAIPSAFSKIHEQIKLHSTVSTIKLSLQIKLGLTQQEIMQKFKSKLRSQIKKGIKNGLESHIGKQELINPFYKVFSINMRDLGSPVHSIKLFESIFKYFYKNAFICLVTYQSQPVAAGFMFKFKNKISNPWASSLKKFRSLNTNMFLYWEMIKFAANLNLDYFDMGRSSFRAATYKFKKQWEPEEKQLYWYRWFLNEKLIDEKPESLYIKAWTRLPVFAANLLGPLVRRNISL